MKAALRHALFGLPLSLCVALPATAGPPMWRVSDADSSIHLFGSIHMFVHDVDWRTPEFDRALNAADLVYFEMVFDEAAYATIGRMTLVEGRIRDGRTLWDLLDEEQDDTVRNAIAMAGLDAVAFDYMQPWMAELMLGGGATQGAEVGVELLVDAEVPAERKRGLETADEQLGFFAAPDVTEQVANLVSTAEQLSIADDRQLLGQLTDAWARGDLEALDNLNRDELGGGDARYDLLITDRNVRWLAELETLLANNDNALVIVGAGHLVGEGGVPELLRQAGYEVERIGEAPATKPIATPDSRPDRRR